MYQIAILDVVNTQLPTMRDESGVWISLKELSEGMGVAFTGQLARLKSDSRYRLEEKVFETNGGKQKKICISINQLPAYLYSINPNKVKASSKELVLKFQEHTFEVINSFWLGDLNTPQTQQLQETILQQNAIIADLQKQLPDANTQHEDIADLQKNFKIILQEHFELENANAKLRRDNINLQRALINFSDRYQSIVLEADNKVEAIRGELEKMTNRFQLLPNLKNDGKNLNTETKAGHSYW